MPKKPDQELSWEPSNGALVLKLGNIPLGYFHPVTPSKYENYRTVLQQMVNDYNRAFHISE